MGTLLARAARRLTTPAVRSTDTGADWRGHAARCAATPTATARHAGAPVAVDSPDPLAYAAHAIAALGIAACASQSSRALGFGTIGCFADERLNLPDPGPTLATKWLARLAPGPLWELSSPAPPAA